jgi:serine/threonine-protein kinase
VGSGGPAPGAHDGGGGAARRAGRWAAVIAAVMVALAVVATVWDFRRGDREAGAARVAVTPSGTAVTKRAAAAAPSRKPRRAAAGPGAVVTTSPTRHGGTAPVRSGAFARVPSKMPEAQPYGPWQCTPGFAVDFRSGTPLAPKPCQMVGRDIRYRGSLTAPGGATGSITVALQDAASGRTVSGPKTCDGLTFGGDAATASCGPASASPVRGRRYAVVMSYRYERRGRTVASMSRGSVFSW